MARIRAVEPSGCVVILLLLLASPVFALNIYVDRLDDEYNGCSLDSCSLREAISSYKGQCSSRETQVLMQVSRSDLIENGWERSHNPKNRGAVNCQS